MDVTVEEQLIANIVAGDEASRAVYADWLDEHDRPIHAEFVRLQGVPASDARLRELSAQLDIRWRTSRGRSSRAASSSTTRRARSIGAR